MKLTDILKEIKILRNKLKVTKTAKGGGIFVMVDGTEMYGRKNGENYEFDITPGYPKAIKFANYLESLGIPYIQENEDNPEIDYGLIFINKVYFDFNINEIKILKSPEDNFEGFVKAHLKIIINKISEKEDNLINYFDATIPYEIYDLEIYQDEDQKYTMVEITNDGCNGIGISLDPNQWEGEGPAAAGEFIQIGPYQLQYQLHSC